MAVLVTKKVSEFTFVITIIIIFATHSFGQCLKKHVQKSRCQNMNNELEKARRLVRNLTRCLEAECNNTAPRKISTIRISKTLTTEDFLKEILKRIVIHIIQNNDMARHLTKCDRTKVRKQLNVLKTWIKKTQKHLGFSNIVQATLPPKLTTSKTKSAKYWCDVQLQMLTNLASDINDMRGYFKKSSCIIHAC